MVGVRGSKSATARLRETQHEVAAPLELSDAAHAPLIYLDGCTNFGVNQDIVNATLFAHRFLAVGQGQIQTDQIVTAHLRMSVAAAQSLKEAIDKALLMAMPSNGGETH